MLLHDSGIDSTIEHFVPTVRIKEKLKINNRTMDQLRASGVSLADSEAASQRALEGNMRAQLRIIRGADGVRHMFYHFGLLSTTIVICAACFGVIDLAGETLDGAAEIMHKHWKNALESNRQVNTQHPADCRAKKTAIREQLMDDSKACGDPRVKVSTKSKSVLFDDKLFEEVTGRSLMSMRDLVYERMRVCSSCFKVVKRAALSCCSPAIAIEMNTFKRPKYIAVAYASGDEHAGILKAAADHLAESARSPAQVLQDIILISPHLYSPGDSSTLPDSSVGSGHRQPDFGLHSKVSTGATSTPIASRVVSTVKAAESGIKAPILGTGMLSLRPGELSLSGDRMYTIASTNRPSPILEMRAERLATEEREGREGLRKNEREVLSHSDRFLKAICFNNVPESDEQRFILAVSRTIDVTAGRHSVVLSLAKEYLEMMNKDVFPNASPVLLAMVGKAPLIVLAGLLPTSENDRNHHHNFSLREFFVSAEHDRRRVKTLAELIIVIITRHYAGAEVLFKGILNIEAQMLEKDLPFEKVDHSLALKAIATCLHALATNRVDLLKDILPHFAFKLVEKKESEGGARSVFREDDDEDDYEDEFGADDDGDGDDQGSDSHANPWSAPGRASTTPARVISRGPLASPARLAASAREGLIEATEGLERYDVRTDSLSVTEKSLTAINYLMKTGVVFFCLDTDLTASEAHKEMVEKAQEIMMEVLNEVSIALADQEQRNRVEQELQRRLRDDAEWREDHRISSMWVQQGIIGFIEQNLRGAINFVSLAGLISLAHDGRKASPTLKNSVTANLEDTENGPTFQTGERVVNGYTLRAMFSSMCNHVKQAFVEMFLPQDASVAAIVYDSLYNGTELDAASIAVSGEMIDGFDEIRMFERPWGFKQATDTSPVKLERTAGVRFIEKLARKAIQGGKDNFMKSVERFREALMSLHSVTGANTTRTKDLPLLELSPRQNLFAVLTMEGEHTLAVFSIVQKTQADLFNILQPFVARLLVVFLQEIIGNTAEVLAKDVMDHLNSVMERDATSQFLERFTRDGGCLNNITRAFKIELSSKFFFRARLSPTFIGWLKKDCAKAFAGAFEAENRNEQIQRVERELEQVCSTGRALYELDVADTRSIIHYHVCTIGFQNSALTVAGYRHVGVNYREIMPVFLKWQALQGSDVQRKLIDGILADVRDLDEKYTSMKALHSTGNHSLETLMSVYAIRSGELGTRAPGKNDLHFRAAERSVSCIAAFAGFPRPAQSSIGQKVPRFLETAKVEQRCLTLYETACNQDGLLEDTTMDEYHLSRLERLGYKDFVSQAQKNMMTQVASMHNATRDCVLARLPCGNGKTLGYVVPLMLASSGQFSLIVVPYKMLLEDLKRSLEDLDIAVEVLAPESSRFQPEAFKTGERSKEDPIKFVLALTDTINSPEVSGFLRLANLLGRLYAVVIDEVHQVILSAVFRDCMRRIPVLASLDVPLVLVSGTCPDPFVKTVLGAFGHNTVSSTIVEELEPRKLRELERPRILHLIRVPSGERDPVNEIAVNVVEDMMRQYSWVTNVLCFSMTKSSNHQLQQALLKRFGSGTDVALVDSKSTAKQRRNFASLFSDSDDAEKKRRKSFVVGCSTSLCAEGVDLDVVHLVVIVGGAFLGSLMIQQMASRAGRGVRTGHARPHAVLIYAPDQAKKYAFGRGKTPAVADREVSELFQPEDRSNVQSVTGFGRMQDFFSPKHSKTCCAILLERKLKSVPLDKPDGRVKCGECNRCLGDAAVGLGSVIRQEWSSANLPTVEENETLRQIFPRVKASLSGDDLLFVARVREWLNALDGTCAVCDGPEHYPNDCHVLRKLANWMKGESCFMCLGDSHTFQDVRTKLEQKKNRPSGSSFGDIATEVQKDEIVSQCAVIIERCSLWRTVRPCSVCWLQHHEDTKPCRRTDTDYRVRSCFLWVWYDPDLRREFYEEWLTGRVEKFEKLRWQDLFEWGVYEGKTLGVQNAFRVVAFVMDVKKRGGM